MFSTDRALLVMLRSLRSFTALFFFYLLGTQGSALCQHWLLLLVLALFEVLIRDSYNFTAHATARCRGTHSHYDAAACTMTSAFPSTPSCSPRLAANLRPLSWYLPSPCYHHDAAPDMMSSIFSSTRSFLPRLALALALALADPRRCSASSRTHTLIVSTVHQAQWGFTYAPWSDINLQMQVNCASSFTIKFLWCGRAVLFFILFLINPLCH
jgi:hypothetical protein